jgi:uncharacterized protein
VTSTETTERPPAPEPPLPTITEENAPFWAGAVEGVLRMQQCGQCAHIRYPIQALCPVCLSAEFAWTDLSGHGTVFSKVVYRQAFHPAYRPRVPYNLAIVQLDEGPRMFSNLREEPDQPLAVGDRVDAVFDRVNDQIYLPRFRRAVAG